MHESPGQGQEKAFNQLSEAEKEARFEKLKTLFDRAGQFRDFWENIYKYTGRYKIEGMDQAQVTDFLNKISRRVVFMEETLDCFGEIKEHESLQENRMRGALEELKESANAGKLLSGNWLDIPNLVKTVEYAFKAYIDGAERTGRSVDIAQGDIGLLTADFEYMAKKVNDYI